PRGSRAPRRSGHRHRPADSGTTVLRCSASPGQLRPAQVAEERLLVVRDPAQLRGERRRGERIAAADLARRGDRELAPAVADLDQARGEALERALAGERGELLEERGVQEAEPGAARADLLL